ncbi:MAG: Crp/Fnr family transcriptional regulator [Bacteroidia bacterium]|nr:Crp/Fnr family transcriptional regulator [Bacteroidia bacterium]
MKTYKNQICNCIDNPTSIFGKLPKSQIDFLRQHHSCIGYKKNEIIYREGDKPTGLISLSEGKVKLFKEGVGGREQIVRLARPVGFIGYRALFAEENYLATAITLENSSVCVIEKDALFEVLNDNSELTMIILKSLATELGFSNSRCVTLTQKHVRGRLAESILVLKDTYGVEDDQKTIKAHLSREDLASLSNMTNSNAIRTLSTFAQEKVIEIDGRKIKILDLHQLEKISELG